MMRCQKLAKRRYFNQLIQTDIDSESANHSFSADRWCVDAVVTCEWPGHARRDKCQGQALNQRPGQPLCDPS